MKYSDYFIDSLAELGYTHCFFVGGGNVMHLLESARTRMKCIAVVHEVSAGIAAEYFNVAKRNSNERAFAMVTAGPGATNIVSAIGAAWLESRELLVVGGQARTEFLSGPDIRQIGHQEIDGQAIVKPITKLSKRIEKPIGVQEIKALTDVSKAPRKGPIFLEVCLDVTATEVDPELLNKVTVSEKKSDSGKEKLTSTDIEKFKSLWSGTKRPLILVGGGFSFSKFQEIMPILEKLRIPVATTWNAIDYLDSSHELYAGRPNTYGMRWANAIIQQSDFVLAIGARLGLQQTGFAWEDFAPVGKVVRIEFDENELALNRPTTSLGLNYDSNMVTESVINLIASETTSENTFSEWTGYIKSLKSKLPLVEKATYQFEEFVNPFELINELGGFLNANDQVIPCSSGGSYTSMMQAFPHHVGQLLTNDKGLASMGYGLAGAIGTSLANPTKRTVLVEGDGGFAQNLSEVGTVANRKLNLKMFIFSNLGYASIRVTQKAYFAGNYLGCDSDTGLELPEWSEIFASYGIPSIEINKTLSGNSQAIKLLESSGPAAFIVKIHPDQSYLPKITSRVFSDGKMRSNPLHLMDPQLPIEIASEVFPYLPKNFQSIEVI